ncbi:MAG: hypothetical protein KJ936_12600 [Proteobacteria bacterium]|nr:hypothetical protein [Pseudomonadota bacterium]MBU2228478.1 hypothetical protein [Pseudomonadota bacterium]MBU2261389.1 hypothetical protein [Pseudomonadota bacterium]
MPGLPIADIPHPMAGQPEERVAEIAADAVPEILRILTGDPARLEEEYEKKIVAPRGRLRHKGLFGDEFSTDRAPEKFKAPSSLEAVQRLFYLRGWTDGLPIIPPTEERVAQMLERWGGDPDEVVGLVAPRRGEATVKKIAINAAMAGCLPEHLPVVIAATRAMIRSEFGLYGLQTTTHPCTVLVLTNGPLADSLEINAGYNAMGQGKMANAVIGRAIRLVLTNIGGGSPGVLDRSTMGSPAKYSFCFAENEEQSPWEPLHVERGFPKTQSTVTVCGVEGPHNVNDHGSQTGEEVLLTIAGVLATPGTNQIYLGGEPLIVLGPEHAAAVAKSGFSKLDVKRYLFEKARVPVHLISQGNMERFQKLWPQRFANLPEEASVPISETPEDIMVIVAGGMGRQSAVIPTFGTTKAVTLAVTDKDDKPILAERKKRPVHDDN